MRGALVVCLLLAGCVSTTPAEGPNFEATAQGEPAVDDATEHPTQYGPEAPGSSPAPVDAPTVTIEETAPAQETAALGWSEIAYFDTDGEPQSEVSVGRPLQFAGDCLGVCPFDVGLPELPADAWYELLVRWDGTKIASMELLGGEMQRGFDSARILTTNTTFSIVGEGEVTGRITILGPDIMSLEGDQRLPNIVTYAPVQVAFGACDSVERSEQGATRCLRLGNAIGNTGDGPLQAVLPWDDGLLSPTGIGGFDQRVLLRAGGHEDHAVGNADFHVSHAHFHYDGFAQFSLYAWDESTGLRGDLAAEHKKSGFCFLDWGPMEDPDRAPQTDDDAETDCLVPWTEGWTMGLTAGWFDFYWSDLTDQYVDVAGVPDGVYELVSTADWNDSLDEVDENDNQASVIVRLQGDTASVLESRAFYEIPAGTSRL